MSAFPYTGVELTPSHEEELKTRPMQGLRWGGIPAKDGLYSLLLQNRKWNREQKIPSGLFQGR